MVGPRGLEPLAVPLPVEIIRHTGYEPAALPS